MSDLPAVPPAVRHGALWLALGLIGATWGATQLLSKLVMQHGQHPLGVALASALIGALLSTGIVLARGGGLPLSRRHLAFYAVCGLTGTALPHSLSYTAMRELPVGIVSIVISMVPIQTFLAALMLRIERPEPRRVLGLVCGAAAVLLLVVPEASLPDPEDSAWIVLPVLVGVSYTAEGLFIGRWQPGDAGPMKTLCGLSWAASLMLAPVVAASGTWIEAGAGGLLPLGLMAVLNVGAYAGFVWLIGRSGPVFASQVGYVVTLAGVLLGMAVLGERHSAWVWLSLVLMLSGLALVRPRR